MRIEGLVEFDRTVKTKSCGYIPAIVIGYSFYGLVSIRVSCTVNKTYGIASGTSGNGSVLVEVDMEQKTVIKNTFCLLPDVVFDAGSITEAGGVQGIGVNSVTIQSQCGFKTNGSIKIDALSASQTTITYSLNTTNNTDGFFNQLTAGQYKIHLEDTKGCKIDTTVAVALRDAVEVQLATAADTCNKNIGNTAVTMLKGTQPAIFALNGRLTGTAPVFNQLAAGNYQLKINDANNCSLDTFFNIVNTNPPSPLKHISVLAESCTATGGELKLTYAAGVTNILGARLNGGGLQTATVFPGLSNGMYQLQVVTSACVYDSVIHIPQAPAIIPVISFINKMPGCTGWSDGSFNITTKDILLPFTVSVNGSNFADRTVYKDLSSGTYQVLVKDSSGCIWNKQNLIDDPITVPPVIRPTITNAECWQSQPGKIRLVIDGVNAPYRFEVNGSKYASGQEITGLVPGNYKAIISTAGHCVVDTLDFAITRQNSNGVNCDTVYVPTAFTPNNDGRNDVIRPIVNGGINAFIFRVYNRYGEPVFETQTPGKGWDGRLKGSLQQTGAYVWLLEGIDSQGQRKLFKGSFVLMR